MNNTFLLFYSPKPRSQVWILIYRKWSIPFSQCHQLMPFPFQPRSQGLLVFQEDEKILG